MNIKYFNLNSSRPVVAGDVNFKIISGFFGLIFFGAAVTLLSYGHLHEDAYILFQYSKNLSNGSGIVFDSVSGPTEGATDFLWMALLALIHSLGIDLGSAAAMLNGLGLALLCYSIFRLRGNIDAISLSAVALTIFSGGMAAALGGFSTLAYGGLFALFVLSIIEKKYFSVAALALIIPLFRPDGVLIVFGGVLTALVGIERSQRKNFLLFLGVSAFLGLGYFFWRYNYFSTILPLPLLVKSKTDRVFEGLGGNFMALKFYILLLIPFIYLIFKNGVRKISWLEFFAAGLGPFLLLVALSFAHQSQNVGYRFQFPIVISLVLIFVFSVNKINNKYFIFLLLPIAGIFFGAKMIRSDVAYLTNNDYINTFPQVLKINEFHFDKIAITEAGRFPFWYDAVEMVDLVGLNSTRVVREGPRAVLKNLQPEIIFVHHAGRFDVSEFDASKPFVVALADQLDLKGKYGGANPVLIAPEAALEFSKENSYMAVLVQYGLRDKNFSHVYFLSPRVDLERFTSALQYSIFNNKTYYESLKLFRNKIDKLDIVMREGVIIF